ncbi:MAG: phosphonate ABC transporter ATP-binding protein [Symploca sp. SIO1C4]|uniref:Phosphonate ABC transporter ATP-binding protein n=1 Tax=Symploca sp. SIO1C4 TaxID=2607765 RepID=A0A6B3NSX3_9CYAN|nr:phosphonate ABC transporter ATP-binding protein [Symploca sp. SIO1C4]
MYVIQINRAGKTYDNGTIAVHPTSLNFEPGTFNAILGPSGAGKSTLLRMINGLETPTTGEILIQGQTLTTKNLRQIRSRTAMVFQQFNLVGRLNVMSNVLTGRLYYSPWWSSILYLFGKRDWKIAQWALNRVSLTEKAWERVDRLSGGQQQRVGVARALAQRPEVILADEPVASLDPVASEEIMELLREICRQDGITIVANLHQVSLAMRYADRVIGLNQGHVVFDDSPQALVNDTLGAIYQREDGSVDDSLEMAVTD